MNRLTTSPTIGKIAAALAAAQGEFPLATASANNPAYSNKPYATLADLLTACRPSLSKHGIAVVQAPYSIPEAPGMMTVVTRLMFEEEWIEGEFTVPIAEQDPVKPKPLAHFYKGALTYARGGGLAALLGIAVEHDDDGNAAAGTSVGTGPAARTAARAAQTPKPTPKPSDPIQTEQVSAIRKYCDQLNYEVPEDLDQFTYGKAGEWIKNANTYIRDVGRNNGRVAA